MNYMKKEDKELLFKDLCARLPYGVAVLSDIDKEFDGGLIGMLCRVEPYVGEKYKKLEGQYLLYQHGCFTPYTVEEVRPYLRPISSMTDEEREDFFKNDGVMSHNPNTDTWSITSFTIKGIDWLNKHHFDYRGLIERGLAIEPKNELKDIYK